MDTAQKTFDKLSSLQSFSFALGVLGLIFALQLTFLIWAFSWPSGIYTLVCFVMLILCIHLVKKTKKETLESIDDMVALARKNQKRV